MSAYDRYHRRDNRDHSNANSRDNQLRDGGLKWEPARYIPNSRYIRITTLRAYGITGKSGKCLICGQNYGPGHPHWKQCKNACVICKKHEHSSSRDRSRARLCPCIYVTRSGIKKLCGYDNEYTESGLQVMPNPKESRILYNTHNYAIFVAWPYGNGSGPAEEILDLDLPPVQQNKRQNSDDHQFDGHRNKRRADAHTRVPNPNALPIASPSSAPASTSSSTNIPQDQNLWSEGYREGHRKGYLEGHREGHRDGYREAYRKGWDAGGASVRSRNADIGRNAYNMTPDDFNFSGHGISDGYNFRNQDLATSRDWNEGMRRVYNERAEERLNRIAHERDPEERLNRIAHEQDESAEERLNRIAHERDPEEDMDYITVD